MDFIYGTKFVYLKVIFHFYVIDRIPKGFFVYGWLEDNQIVKQIIRLIAPQKHGFKPIISPNQKKKISRIREYGAKPS